MITDFSIFLSFQDILETGDSIKVASPVDSIMTVPPPLHPHLEQK